jgi:heme-degrading monooxygenase HmoA
MAALLPSDIAATPEPPYYAAIFTSLRRDGDDGYEAMAEAMAESAARQDGYLGMESVRDGLGNGLGNGLGITVSYWRDLEAIAAWKRAVDHLVAQKLGRERWYSAYCVRIARVERSYAFGLGNETAGWSHFRSDRIGTDS